MKVLSTIFILLMLASCSTANENYREQLAPTVEKFNEAYVQGDTLLLANMITENYVHTNSSWKSFGKEKWLSYMKNRREKLDDGTIEMIAYTMDEYAVEFFEHTAIVTARINNKGIEDGMPYEKSFRVTNLWIYKDGNWKRAAFHDTSIE